MAERPQRLDPTPPPGPTRPDADIAGAFEGHGQGYYLLDSEWRFTDLNEAACRIIQRSRDELLGRVVWEIFPMAVVGDFERQFRLSATKKEARQFEAYYPAPLDSWFQVRVQPAEDGVAVSFRDVGPHRALHERVVQAQRIETMTTLAGGIAHDYNDLLTVIAGHASLLDVELGPDHPHRAHLDAIREAAARGAELTHQLLSFSQHQVIVPQVLDLNAAIGTVLPALRQAVTASVELRVVSGPGPIMVEVDPGEVARALLHLIVNAGDAIDGSGTITIATSGPGTDTTGEPSDADGPSMATLTVTDDGRGMSPEVRARAFEPFFTSKRRGSGTGLGLAAVHGMVRQAGAEVSLASEQGRGTTVTITIPVVAPPAPGEPEPVAVPRPRRAHGPATVLVVDDNPNVRALTGRVLADHGHRVLEAGGAAEAEARGTGAEGPVHLLVTDVVMPDVSGPELARSLARAIGPIPVLYMSGYADAVSLSGIDVGSELLHKPFSPQDLLAAAERLLAAPSPAGS